MPKLACCIVKSGRYTACVCQGHIPKHCVRHRNPLKKTKKTSCAEHCTDFSISNTPIYLSDTISASPSSCPLFWQTHSRGIRLHSLSRTERHVCATREGGGRSFQLTGLNHFCTYYVLPEEVTKPSAIHSQKKHKVMQAMMHNSVSPFHNQPTGSICNILFMTTRCPHEDFHTAAKCIEEELLSIFNGNKEYI